MDDDSISLDEAAQRLGVHYMTAYRYVRTGRLPARKVGAEWRVDPGDVERLGQPAAAPTAPRRRRRDYPQRLEGRLIVGDEVGAWTVLQGALAAGVDPAELYLEVVAPTMTSIGAKWADGQLTVAEEHQASTVLLRLVGRLGPLFRRPGRTRGTVVLGAPPGDQHGVPSALLADLLRLQSFHVIDLGADTPARSFADTASAADRLVVVGLSATTEGNDDRIAEAITAAHGAVSAPVLLGGRAITDEGHARRLGADLYSASADQAIELTLAAADAATRRRRASRRAGA